MGNVCAGVLGDGHQVEIYGRPEAELEPSDYEVKRRYQSGDFMSTEFCIRHLAKDVKITVTADFKLDEDCFFKVNIDGKDYKWKWPHYEYIREFGLSSEPIYEFTHKRRGWKMSLGYWRR